MVDENSEDISVLDANSRDFLKRAIADYNSIFGTSYDTSSDKFQNYYKDVGERVKNREIDILFATWFPLPPGGVPQYSCVMIKQALRRTTK